MFVDTNTFKLLRIPFSFLLMPLFLFAFSQAESIHLRSALWSFSIIHLLVYPASNGYNSYIDRDETPIGGLEKPPLPTTNLFFATLFLDICALLLSFFCVNRLFALCVLLYIIASRAYSSKQIRLKKHPFAGFFTVVFFQGAFTFYMSYIGIAAYPLELNKLNIILLLGCSLQIAGAYPLTQIYQHQQDLKDGITTISYKLGYVGTFIFTAGMFVLCNLCYFLYFNSLNWLSPFYIIQLFFAPIVAYFAYWFFLVLKNKNEANFKNTMRMNIIAATSMNICFTSLFFIK
ncbi:MAG: UbiA prenyltransferase family protein [Bacteroidetes bacterium]|nr:UbiA prenyltransferase family protein [Bacteroidota bacterium]